MSDRTYWLIEMQGPAWLMIQEMAGGKHHGYVWTGDVQEALRFYSERQAELVMMAVRQDHRDLFPTCLIREPRPTEHMWVTQSLADLPEQPFNYRHPSKYGTDVPRRCYLEELTSEERAIRDLVDTVERLGAHPLLTATVIQLMKAGEDLADWVDIGLRDKAIAALSPGNDLGLLDDGQRSADLSNSLPSAPAATDDDWEDSCGDISCDECHGPRPSVSDYSRGAQDAIDSIPRMEGDSAEYYRGYDATIESTGPVETAPQIPEGFVEWSGGECPVPGQSVEYLCAADDVPVKTDRPEDWTWRHEGIPSRARIIAYRIIEPSPQPEPLVPLAEAVLQTLPGGVEESRDQSDERIEDVSQATDPDRVDRVEQADVLLENQPGVSSQASSTDAEELPPAFSAAEIADAERDGALAAAAGMFRSDNPYVAMSSKWEGWLAGYASGHKPYCPTCLTACRFDIQGCAVCDHNYTVWSGLAPSTPEGAECPVASDAYVDVLLRDGGGEGGPAGEVDWHHSLFHNHPNDVVLYRLQSASPRYDEDGLLIRKPSSDAERTEVASEPRDTNEQTGIFQSQTEAALTDKDEPDPAPYAPINAEEPAGDAAVFARGPEREKELIAEADALEVKRPFWMFAKKEMA